MDHISYDMRVAHLVDDAIKKDDHSIRATAIGAGIPYATLDRRLKNGGFTVDELRRLGLFLRRPTESFLPDSALAGAVAS